MTSEFVVGTVGVVFALAFAFAVGATIAAFRRPVPGGGLALLAEVIDGRVEGDVDVQWATGSFDGLRIRARAMPGRSTGRPGREGHYNAFETVVLDVPGRSDWRIDRVGVLDSGESRFEIVADDEALRQRLAASKATFNLESIGNPPSVRYVAAERALYLHEDVTPMLAPTPERFRGLLWVAKTLAAINAEVNPPA